MKGFSLGDIISLDQKVLLPAAVALIISLGFAYYNWHKASQRLIAEHARPCDDTGRCSGCGKCLRTTEVTQ